MNTLLLRLAGPMQSWGTQSRFTIRDTGYEPSKSGVIGLLCAALGKPRDESHLDNQGKPMLSALAALRMGVRVDREGVLQKDYHTADGSRHDDYGVVKASGAKGDTVVSHRYYLADADFLLGLESASEELYSSLIRRWQTHIGSFSWGASHLCHPCLCVSLTACFVIRPWKRRCKRIGPKIYEANRWPVCVMLLSHRDPIRQQRKYAMTYRCALPHGSSRFAM